MFGRDRGFAERDAQRVHFRVVADFHGHSKIIGIDGCHNYFSGFLHEHGPDLFRRINSAVPAWKILPSAKSNGSTTFGYDWGARAPRAVALASRLSGAPSGRWLACR